MASKWDSVDAYVAALPHERRAAVEELRRTIRAAAPEAIESIAYDMPAFRLNDAFLVSYAAFKNHYSMFHASGAVVAALGDEIRPRLRQGTILPDQGADPCRSRDQGCQNPTRRTHGAEESLTLRPRRAPDVTEGWEATGWSNSFGILGSRTGPMSASTQASRSRRRCSRPMLSTNSGL